MVNVPDVEDTLLPKSIRHTRGEVLDTPVDL